MNPSNLKQAQKLCARLDSLKSHQIQFLTIVSPDLPTDQDDKQKLYLNDLQKEIKKTEKEIADL